MSGINSGHHNLPIYEISLKSNNVEFVWYCGGHFEFHIRIKNVYLVEDHSMNIHVQFGFKPLGQLKPNCPGMIIGRCSVFYADRKSKMAATTGHSINTGPYRENS
jgi:hypothetical protein